MRNFQPHINPIYPPNNNLIFEEWFAQNYNGSKTDRELLPFFPTSYWVNNNYAQDPIAKKEAQDYIDSLPDKKYFVICQYDDGCLIDWKGKDVLEFNMSKKIGVELPLLCMPHPYKFSGEKKHLVNFVGSRTHQIRNELERFKGNHGWYISYERHEIEDYCRVMSESIFTLCPRGYGINSFRIAEALQYNSIPIYLSDEWVIPFGLWSDFILYVHSTEVDSIPDLVNRLVDKMPFSSIGQHYEKIYSYDGCFKMIIKSLETEYNQRKG